MGRSSSRDRRKKDKDRKRDRDRDDRDSKKDRDRRDRSRDRGDRDRGRREKSEEAKYRRWRFDSPPKEEEIARDAMGLGAAGLLAGGVGGLAALANNPLAALVGGGGLAQLSGIQQLAQGTQQNSKQDRELYVGNLPAGISTPQLIQFLNQVAQAVQVNTSPGDPITQANMGSGGAFAFVEFRSAEEATNGLKLNGVELLGSALKVGRPKGAEPAPQLALPGPGGTPNLADMLQNAAAGRGALPNLSAPPAGGGGALALPAPAGWAGGGAPAPAGGGGQLALPGPAPPVQSAIDQRLCLVNIPLFVSEERVKELLVTFGNLKFFAMQKDEEGKSVGVAFFEYQDVMIQQQAKAALEGLELGSNKLSVKRPDEVMHLLPKTQQLGVRIIPSRVLFLKGLLRPDDLKTDEEYNDICMDIRLEGEKFGALISMEVPRPFKDNAFGQREYDVNAPGVGFAFLEFAAVEGSSKAKKGLHGRNFGENQVNAEYFNETKYASKDFLNPDANTEVPQWAKDAQAEAQTQNTANLALAEAAPEMIE